MARQSAVGRSTTATYGRQGVERRSATARKHVKTSAVAAKRRKNRGDEEDAEEGEGGDMQVDESEAHVVEDDVDELGDDEADGQHDGQDDGLVDTQANSDEGLFPEGAPIPHKITAWHPANDFKVKFDVTLVGGNQAILSEYYVQHMTPTLVDRYWKSVGGREAVTGFDQYHAFCLLNHKVVRKGKGKRKGKVAYEVHWVGYSESDSS
ncbi:hypothetical protein ACHAPU_008446 [Fusarium lateritium]